MVGYNVVVVVVVNFQQVRKYSGVQVALIVVVVVVQVARRNNRFERRRGGASPGPGLGAAPAALLQ